MRQITVHLTCRGLLLQYGVPYTTASKKADLVAAFEQNIKPQASVSRRSFRPPDRSSPPLSSIDIKSILATSRGVQPSNSGIISVASDGTETASVTSVPAKRSRGRPRKTIPTVVDETIQAVTLISEEPTEPLPEPPVKRSRGRASRAATGVEVEIEVSPPVPAPTKKPKAGRKSEAQPVPIEEGLVVEVQHATPVRATYSGRTGSLIFRSNKLDELDLRCPLPLPASRSHRRLLPADVDRSSPHQSRSLARFRDPSHRARKRWERESPSRPSPSWTRSRKRRT